MRLDPIAKEVWCEALRSGEFKQTTGELKNDLGFCCLGVAAEIFPWLEQAEDEYLLDKSSCNLLRMDYETQLGLAGMNDGGMTFPEIADYIEANL